MRPRDAATLLVLDTSGGEPKLLMGQRHHGLKFMPGKFVFPGGRVEPQDYLASVGSRMPGPIRTKLLRHLSGSPHPQRAYAMVHAALRETQEETGIVIGKGAKIGSGRRIAGFRRVCAAGPGDHPGRDARAASTPAFSSYPPIALPSEPPLSMGSSSRWNGSRSPRRAQQDLPSITRMILEDLDARISAGSVRDPEASVPFYFMRGACFHRRLL